MASPSTFAIRDWARSCGTWRPARRRDPHVLRAIVRAWSWRRQPETGPASTIQDIAAAGKLTQRFVSRMTRLAWLSPDVLEHLVIRRMPPALSLNDLVAVAERSWVEQMNAVFVPAPRNFNDFPQALKLSGRCAKVEALMANQHSPGNLLEIEPKDRGNG